MNRQKITATITLTLILALTITTYQTINLQNQLNTYQTKIDELTTQLNKIKHRYSGNPFTTALYPGQLQAENITGMHWYTYLSGVLQNRTDVIAYPSQPARFIVENVSGTVIWKDGTNGTVYATGATPAEATNIINWALGNLTAGRTWKEKVVLKGNFTVASRIDLVSYLTFVLDGKITLASGTDTDLIFASGKSYIDIIGGIFDHNGANQASGSTIYLSRCTNVTIDGATLQNGHTYNLRLYLVSDSVFINSVFDGAGNDNIYTYNTCNRNIFKNNKIINGGDMGIEGGYLYDSIIEANIVRDNADIGIKVAKPNNRIVNNYISGNSYGIDVLSGANQTIVSGNVVVENTVSGIYLDGAGDGCSVVGNIICSNGGHGIQIGSNRNYYTIADNVIMFNGYHGITAGNIGGVIKGNIIGNNNQANGTYHGIYMTGASSKLTVEGNYIFDNQDTPTQRYGVYSAFATLIAIIKNNFIEGNVDGAIGGSLDSCIIEDNYGFVTENSGTITFSGTSVSFTHGLAGTPTQVFASFNSTGYGGWSWTANSTHITITVANLGDYTVYWRAYYEP